jgi:DNA-binding NtrC family response regulator
MHPLTVVVAQSDCMVAEKLAANLHAHFKNVVVARDVDEIRHHIQREVADVLVVDLDMAELMVLRGLVQEFKNVGVVCTHRIPDEEMWKRCMEIGALDCCSCCDVQSIVRAARRHQAKVATASAA